MYAKLCAHYKNGIERFVSKIDKDVGIKNAQKQDIIQNERIRIWSFMPISTLHTVFGVLYPFLYTCTFHTEYIYICIVTIYIASLWNVGMGIEL